MQKGHVRPAAPILLILLVATVTLSLCSTSAFARRSDVGPLIPINGLKSADPASRPVFGHDLPTPPIMMQAQSKQGSGPNADDNLTETAAQSSELQPNASPGPSQNRIVFASNGVDVVVNGALPPAPGAAPTPDGRIDPTLPADADYNLWIMRSDGTEQYLLADLPGDQMDPCYDPGGRMIVYAQPVNNVWQIFTIEIRDPSIVHQITTGPGNKRHPTWSPDDNWICFESSVNGNWDLYKILATGQGQPFQVTSGPSNDRDPAWAPTGTLIAFTRETGGMKRIFTTDPDGTTVEQVSDGGGTPTANDQEPAWRQSATELAFASTRLTDVADATTDLNVWRMPAMGEANGAVPVLVSNSSLTDLRDDMDPTWTVDIDRAPTRVVFVSKRANNQPDIWAMQMKDWIAPLLTKLPTALPRVCPPGNDVTVTVPVYDKDSGVKQVFARFKDPDQKLYSIQSGHYFDASYTTGVRYLETDCATVGQVELLDDDGDGIFDGVWSTPGVATGHDYIIDIVVTDNAGNSLTYDDVYGFTTRTFSPRSNILFVDDYCEGQQFIALLGWNNTYFAAFPVESYYTNNPSYHEGNQGTVDFDTIRDSYGETYDTWRVICRGPVPAAVYQYYQPTIEYQLDPTKLDNEGSLDVVADRQVAVADRAIVWAAPHTGDVWIADGSIMDASTQADVAGFVRRGGRLFMAGEDIAWALTLNGTRTNNFLTTTLRANFVADCGVSGPSLFVLFLGRSWRMQGLGGEFGLTGLVGDPVADDPWGGGHYPHVADRPLQMTTARITRPTSPWFTDAAQYSMRPDSIQVLDAIKIYGMAAGEAVSNFGGPAAGLRYEDTSIANGGRVVFLSFGFEQVHRGYHTEDNLSHCRNMRSHLMHNALCWMRNGGFQGRVVSISDGGAPINDPAPIVSARVGGQVIYAVRCQKDGTYIMQGLPPGYYELQAARPGFEVQHFDGELVHGGQYPRTVDFAVKRGQPGAVSGQVTAASDGKPLANVAVSVAPDPAATNPPSAVGLPDPVISSADGSYTLPYVPPGQYIITANGQQILYSTEDTPATINPGDTTTVDFALNAADGTLMAHVTDIDAPATNIRNAAVAVTAAGGTRTVSYTDDTGTVSVPLAPGDYTVIVSASGYQTSAKQSFAIEPALTHNLPVGLKHEPGGGIRGRVVTAGSGGFVGGVTIRVLFGTEEIASTTTSASALDPGAATQYNYEINNVDTGQVTVVAERSGFTAVPTSRTVVIESGKITGDANFSMQSLYTFPVGLQLISLPWDYSSVDPATLLGIGSAKWGMATWEAARQRYRLYPDAPADRFRLGTGYWMNLTQRADLTLQGIDAEDPVEIPLAAGWNLVGCPYNRRIDFYTVQVRDSSNVVYSLQQALSKGLIGSGLYAYVLSGYQSVGVLSPYTGYWLKTYEPCSLIVSAKVGALAADATRDATPKTKDGWLLQLKTAAAGAEDTATFIGTARSATSGCDFGLDQAKPPVPAMGQYLYTAIDNRGWANAAGDYAVDVRTTGQKSAWDLKVYTNMVGQKVRLSWGDMSGLPHDVRPMLLDLDNGRQVYMRTSSAYIFTAEKSARRLQVVIGAAGPGMLSISPQAAVATAAGTAISYTLSQSANVDVTVSNIAGRVVRRVVVDQVQSAGQNSVLWDGRDAAGRLTPQGRYLITVVGRAASGQQARSIMPLQKVSH